MEVQRPQGVHPFESQAAVSLMNKYTRENNLDKIKEVFTTPQTYNGMNLLTIGLAYNSTDVVRHAIDIGHDVNFLDYRRLEYSAHIAIKTGNIDIVRMFLDKGALLVDPECIISHLKDQGTIEMTQYLIDSGLNCRIIPPYSVQRVEDLEDADIEVSDFLNQESNRQWNEYKVLVNKLVNKKFCGPEVFGCLWEYITDKFEELTIVERSYRVERTRPGLDYLRGIDDRRAGPDNWIYDIRVQLTNNQGETNLYKATIVLPS